MQYGIDNEAIVRQLWSEKTGMDFQPDVSISKSHTFMMASLDGLCGTHVLEIKCAGEEDHDIAISGKIPKKYFPQVQHQMSVYGVDSMTYLSAHKIRDDKWDLRAVQVGYDHDYVNDMIPKEKAFWEKVIYMDPPEMTALDKVCKDTDPEWVPHWLKAKSYKEQMDYFKDMYDEEKSILVKMANGRSVEGQLGKFTRSLRKGNVDYSKIPELQGVDLNPYRKEPIEAWTATFA
jgi:predicted phage-related endonuclease